jgi:hypothetical protein
VKQQARQPRQAPGEALVAVSLMVPVSVKAALEAAAAAEQRSCSQVGRRALEASLGAGGPTTEALETAMEDACGCNCPTCALVSVARLRRERAAR